MSIPTQVQANTLCMFIEISGNSSPPEPGAEGGISVLQGHGSWQVAAEKGGQLLCPFQTAPHSLRELCYASWLALVVLVVVVWGASCQLFLTTQTKGFVTLP